MAGGPTVREHESWSRWPGPSPRLAAASRDEPTVGEVASFGPFRLTRAERLLARDGAPVAIGGRALDVLIALIDRAGEVVSARELIDLVWPDVTVEEANLRVHIAALRKVLGDGKDGSRYIVNVAGRGYTFVAPVQRSVADRTAPIAAPAPPGRPRNLPAPLQLVGRNETVSTLSLLLLSSRFVSVVGPGGIGKTTVAVAVGHALRQEFGDDAVCFVDLGSLTRSGRRSQCRGVSTGLLCPGARSRAVHTRLPGRQADAHHSRQLRACDRGGCGALRTPAFAVRRRCIC